MTFTKYLWKSGSENILLTEISTSLHNQLGSDSATEISAQCLWNHLCVCDVELLWRPSWIRLIPHVNQLKTDTFLSESSSEIHPVVPEVLFNIHTGRFLFSFSRNNHMFVFGPNDSSFAGKQRKSLQFELCFHADGDSSTETTAPPPPGSPPLCCFHFGGEQHPENEALSPTDWTDPVHMMWCVEIRAGSGPHPHIWITEAGAPSGQLVVLFWVFSIFTSVFFFFDFFFSSFSQSSAVRFQPWQKRGPAWIQWAVNNQQTQWTPLCSLLFPPQSLMNASFGDRSLKRCFI